jgi:hypothetical protein
VTPITILLQQNAVTLQPVGSNGSLFHRRSNPAARLGHVPAVTVATFPNEGSHFGKAARQLPGLDAPETHLTEPGGVHQEAAGIEGQHHRRDSSVLSSPDPGADLADPELEAGLHRVE